MPNYQGVWDITTQFQYAAEWNSDNPNPSIALFAGGNGNLNVIEKIIMGTSGDATDFGDLTSGGEIPAACGSTTRGVWLGGERGSASNIIDFVTFASAGNASDFGDLSAATRLNAAHSSATRGVVGGGIVSSRTDTIDYITIASEGNASDFGNLLEAKSNLGSTSSTTRGLFAWQCSS